MRTSQTRKLRRAYWRKALAPVILTLVLIVLGVFLGGSVLSVLDLPVVYKAMPGKVIGCSSEATGWKMVDAKSPTCKKVLAGQYNTEWVSP